MSGSNPKYLPVPKKIPYNIRLPKPLLDKLNAYAELTGNTTTNIVISALSDVMKDKIVFNDYLPDVKGISIYLPLKDDEKEMFINSNLNVSDEYSSYDTFTVEFGYSPTTEPYEILKIPNNLDVFTESHGYITPDDDNRVTKHSGIEFVIFPEVYMEYMEYNNPLNALYCFYFEVIESKISKIILIDYLDAINKANDKENVNLKNNLMMCVNELQQLQHKLNDCNLDDIDAIENYTYETLKDIAKKYNTGNIIPLGENIADAVVTAKINDKPEYFDEFMDDVMDNTKKYVDVLIPNSVAKIVDYRLTNIEKMVTNAESKDEIVTAIKDNKIKTNK